MFKGCIIRENVTATTVSIDVLEINTLRRWIASNIRGSGCDVEKYHFIGYSDILDISSTDTLEEVTGTVTGTVYKIVNKRTIENSHLEFDLERVG